MKKLNPLIKWTEPLKPNKGTVLVFAFQQMTREPSLCFLLIFSKKAWGCIKPFMTNHLVEACKDSFDFLS